MSIKNLLIQLKKELSTIFNVKPTLTSNYKKLNERCIYSLLFTIYYLEQHSYTLTHICLHDFEVSDQILYLTKDTHIVELLDDHYMYESSNHVKEKIEFIPDNITYKNHKYVLYKSVGLFMFYLVTKKIKTRIVESDLDALYYTKPYFFIKNALDVEPALIYL
jgi:hypothetical protein